MFQLRACRPSGVSTFFPGFYAPAHNGRLDQQVGRGFPSVIHHILGHCMHVSFLSRTPSDITSQRVLILFLDDMILTAHPPNPHTMAHFVFLMRVVPVSICFRSCGIKFELAFVSNLFSHPAKTSKMMRKICSHFHEKNFTSAMNVKTAQQ